MRKYLQNKIIVIFFGILVCFSSAYGKDETKISEFSKNVTFHVLFHELAHALIREFELPVLANEEAMADSFSTIWITLKMRDNAASIITARTQSWLQEDSAVASEDYDFKGEHLLDIRRAYQTACLFYGLDPAEFKKYIHWLKFSKNDLSDCSDTAPDQEKGWLDILEPYRLTSDTSSKKVELIYGEGPMKNMMKKSGILDEFVAHVKLFDWPHKITIHFDHCDIGASWSRSKKRILLCDDYVQRFIQQGENI